MWQRFLPYRLAVIGVNVLAHGLVTTFICVSSDQYGAVAAGLSFLGPFICFLFGPQSVVEVTACLGVTLLVSACLVPYMIGHLRRPCLRGAVFTSTGVAGWFLCGLTCVTLFIAASG